jgi:hypothetical protein
VKEIALQNAARLPDNPADDPGLHMLQVRSFFEAQPVEETTTLLWRAATPSTSSRTMTACRM